MDEQGKGPRGPVPEALSDFSVRTGGQHRLVAQATNFARHSTEIGTDEDSRSPGALRFRQWVNLFHEPSGRYGVYLQAEYGHVFLGEDLDFPKRSGDEPDESGVELRRGHLWLVPYEGALLRVGVLGWSDKFGAKAWGEDALWSVDEYHFERAALANSIWDFNPAGAVLEGEAEGGLQYRGSLLWLAEGDDTLTGNGSALLLGADVDQTSEALRLGASLYFLRDDGSYSYGDFGGPQQAYGSSWDSWAGARASWDAESFRTSGYVILNYGEVQDPGWSHLGMAGRLALDLPRGDDTFSAQLLGSTGGSGDPTRSESSEFRTIAQSERDDLGAQGYWSYLALSSPHGPADLNDLGVGLQNRGLGLLTGQLAWRRQLSPTLASRVAGGYLRAARESPVSGSAYMGFELLGELHWQCFEQLGFDVGAACFAPGDFYRAAGGGGPDTLFSVFFRMQLEF